MQRKGSMVREPEAHGSSKDKFCFTKGPLDLGDK